jgi:hypothetical protein
MVEFATLTAEKLPARTPSEPLLATRLFWTVKLAKPVPLAPNATTPVLLSSKFQHKWRQHRG